MILLPALALLLTVPQDAAAVDPRSDLTERGAALLADLHGEGDFPGGSAALVLASGAPIPLVVGTDAPAGRPITPADRFCAGSVGKTFFAAAALRRVARGELDLDARAVDLVDDERVRALPGGGTMTVRQLLRHESGLPRYIETPSFWSDLRADPDRGWKRGDQLKYVAGRELSFAAGEGWAYSDTNYIVLGLVLEALSETSTTEEIRTHLLEPHGLGDVVAQDARVLPGLVQGHSKVFAGMGFPPRVLDDEGRFCVHPSFEWGGGGYATTPTDLARWARLLWTGAAFEGEYLSTMLQSVPAPMLGGRYGLGVIERDTRAGLLLGHDGIFLGYLTAMGYFPELDVAVAFQVNTDSARAVGRPMHEVLVDLALLAGDVR